MRRELAACCVPQLLVAADFSLLGVNGPALRSELAMSEGELAWCFSAYSLAFGAVLLPCGALADRLDRTRLLRAGLLVFAAGALGAALAPDGTSLVLFRALQGAGAASTVPAALALLVERFEPGPARVRALASYGAVVSVGFVGGALAGGAAGAAAGWRAGFAVEVTAALLAVVLVGAPRGPRRRRRARSTAGPPELWPVLRLAQVRAAGVGAATLTASGTAGIVLLSLSLQEHRGLTVLQTSWLMVAFGAPAPAAGALARRLTRAAGPGGVLPGGLLAQAAGLGVLGLLGSGAPLGLLALGLALFGAGHVVASAGVPLLALDGIAAVRQGTVSGAVSTAQFAGASVGPLAAAAAAGVATGLGLAASACGAVAILLVLVVVRQGPR